MQIGEVVERTGLSLHTVRHYDEVGLVRPSRRSEGGFRLYSEDDVQRFLLVRRMKPLGFSVEEMRDLLAVVDALAASTGEDRLPLLAELRRFREAAGERRATIESQLAMADEFLGLVDRLQRA